MCECEPKSKPCVHGSQHTVQYSIYRVRYVYATAVCLKLIQLYKLFPWKWLFVKLMDIAYSMAAERWAGVQQCGWCVHFALSLRHELATKWWTDPQKVKKNMPNMRPIYTETTEMMMMNHSANVKGEPTWKIWPQRQNKQIKTVDANNSYECNMFLWNFQSS